MERKRAKISCRVELAEDGLYISGLVKDISLLKKGELASFSFKTPYVNDECPDKECPKTWEKAIKKLENKYGVKRSEIYEPAKSWGS